MTSEKKNKKDYAIELLEENACMINGLLTKQEMRKFNGDFVHYLVNCLNRLNRLEK